MKKIFSHEPPLNCNKCSRLIEFRKKIVKKKRKQFIDQKYWGKPITGFGDINAKMLFVGLAPAAHGATRTGRVGAFMRPFFVGISENAYKRAKTQHLFKAFDAGEIFPKIAPEYIAVSIS